MQQKVPLLFPLILILVLVVLLFFFFQSAIEKAGLESRYQVQTLLLQAHLDRCDGKMPDSAALNKLEPFLQQDSLWVKHLKCLTNPDKVENQ
jgi:hypothetical protein